MAYTVVNGKLIRKYGKPRGKVNFLAIRHCENGGTEYVHAECEVDNKLNDKNQLLGYICSREWGNKPPAAAIAQYLVQTKSYEMFTQMDTDRDIGFIINFYEYDKELSDSKGKAYSCRDIMAVPKAYLMDNAADICEAV